LRAKAQKATISLKPEKVEKSYYLGPRNLPSPTNTLSNGTIPEPQQPFLPQDWGLATPSPHLKSTIAIISGMGEATDCNFGQNIHRVYPKSPLKILVKRECGRIHGLCQFLGTSTYLRNG